MKKTVITGLVALVASAAVYAADVEVDVGMYSAYIWRGMTLDNRPVAQGSVSVSSTNGFYGSVWGNFSQSDDFVGEDYNGLNEVDYNIGYGGTYEMFDYDLGYIYYSFPNTDYSSTQEIYGGVALNNLVVTPSVYVYYDFQEVDGFYVVGDLNYSTDLSDALSMEVGASLAWGDSNYNDAWYGRDTDSMSDMTVYTGLSYALSDTLSLNGTLAYTCYPDSAASDAAEDSYSYDDNVWGGVSLTYSF